MNIATTSQTVTRLAQFDRQRGVELRAYDEGGFLQSESELSFSEAAQRIARGETVAFEEVAKEKMTVSYTQSGIFSGPIDKEADLTLTQRMRTRIDSAEELQQFAQFRLGEAPSSDVEKLAARLKGFEGHVNHQTRDIEAISQVKTGFLGGKKLVDGPGLSAFEAAQIIAHGGTIALTQLPVLAMAEALITGSGESGVKEAMKTRFVSGEADLDALRA